MKKTTIEGLTSPAAIAASGAKSSAAPVFKVEIRRSLRMHTTAAICVAAAVFLLVVAYGLTLKPVYMAKSLTYIEPLTKSVLSDGTGATFDPSRYESYLQQQMQTATRPDILEAALAKLPPGTFQQPGESTQSAVTRLQSALKVERVTTSYQLSISLTGADPVATAATVNAVTNAYLDQGRHDEHEVTDERLKLLGEERQRIQTELDQDKAEQASLGQLLGVANPVGDAANPYDMQLANVRGELQGARQAHDVAAAQLASVRNQGGVRTPGMVASADELIAGDAGLSSMKSTINQRKATLSTQMAGLTPSNPVYKQDQDEIADLDKSLDAMTTQLRDKAERRLEDKLGLELQRTGDIEARLNGQLAQQTATATNAGPRLQRAAELAANLTRLTTRYATVDDAMRGMELEANGPGLAHLSVAATVPTSPEASRKRLLLLSALPLALFAGILVAVILHRRDPRVYTARDVEDVLGFMPMGVLPARDEVSDAVVEEYLLRLAAGLESAYRVSAARSYVFTAASSQIDVTEFVESLSRKLRQLGLTAMIVEPAGLLQPVRESGATGDLIRPLATAHDGFATANLERLKADHDLLLIDAPPLLHSAETEYAVRCADATILIAECGVTLRGELLQSASLLERLNVAGVGAVLQELHLNVADVRFRSAISVLEGRITARQPSKTTLSDSVSARDLDVQPEPMVKAVESQPEPVPVPLPVLSRAEVQHEAVPEQMVEVVETPLRSTTEEARDLKLVEVEKAVPEMPLPVAPVARVAPVMLAEPIAPIAPVPMVTPVSLVTSEVPVSEAAALAAAHDSVIKVEPLVAPIEYSEPDEDLPAQKGGWLQRLFKRDRYEAVSILPDNEDDEEELPVVNEAAKSYDIAPRAEMRILQPLEAVNLPEPELKESAHVTAAAEVDEPALQPEVVRVVASEPPPVAMAADAVQEAKTEVVTPSSAPAAMAAPEPAFVQSFEEAVFEREPSPSVIEVEPEAAPAFRPQPSVVPAVAAETPLQTVAEVRSTDAQRSYAPPVAVAPAPAVRSSVEPFTTGRWEPVRAARQDSLQGVSGSREAATTNSVPATPDRSMSRVSGGRRAVAAEPRGAEQGAVRPIPANGWVPPVPAVRNVNPLGDDGFERGPNSLTRRWELLSRFDKTAGPARPADEAQELVAQGRPTDLRSR